MTLVHIKMPPDLLEQIDQFRKRLPFAPSRSELIRSFVRAQLEQCLELEQRLEERHKPQPQYGELKRHA